MLSACMRTFSHFPLRSLQRNSNPLIFSSTHMLIQNPDRHITVSIGRYRFTIPDSWVRRTSW